MKSLHILRIMLLLLTGMAVLFPDINAAQRHGRRHQHGREDRPLKIVCSFSDYASVAEAIVRGRGRVHSISHGDQDPHFVPPKPSYALLLRDADLWVTTGLDLEMWAATLLDKARNRQIMDGEIGFVSASDGVNLVEVVPHVDRTEGDIHLMGNPHIHTGPLNLKVVANNITVGLKKIDPENSAIYDRQRDVFCDRIDRALFGEELVDLMSGPTLCKLLENNMLFIFLEKEYQGRPLKERLGGWLKEGLPFRGKRVIAYHKNWTYFMNTFGLEIAGYIEPKPGIPPSAKHVENMMQLIRDQQISIMLVASYFEKKTPRMIEEKTGVKAVFLPLSVNGIPEVQDNFQLYDYWIDQLNQHLQ